MIHWQLVLAVIAIAAAASYVLRAAYQTLRGRSSCCSGGCDGSTERKGALISNEELLARLRGKQNS
jgi:hypothetical protein